MAEVLTRRALNRATLARQLLLSRDTDLSPVQAVERLVGMQAQAPFSPYYGLWSRLDGFDPEGFGQLLVDRAVVRIVLMRGTVHLVSAADCLFLRPLVQPLLDRVLLANPLYARQLDGLDVAEVAAAARVLLEERPLTNAELGPLLAERWPDRDPAALVQVARGRLALVQVPPRAVWGRSGQPRLTTAESWLGRPLKRAPSPRAMVLRYLVGFGPASVADAQTWSGLTRLREVVEPMRKTLRVYRDENGVELFDLPDAPRPDPDTPAPVRFLPDFDNLLRSHADRTRVISDADRRRIATRNGVAPHSVLVDGVFAGTWKINQRRGAATLEITPATRLRRADEAALTAEGRRLLAFAAAGSDARDVVISAGDGTAVVD